MVYAALHSSCMRGEMPEPCLPSSSPSLMPFSFFRKEEVSFFQNASHCPCLSVHHLFHSRHGIAGVCPPMGGRQKAMVRVAGGGSLPFSSFSQRQRRRRKGWHEHTQVYFALSMPSQPAMLPKLLPARCVWMPLPHLPAMP